MKKQSTNNSKPQRKAARTDGQSQTKNNYSAHNIPDQMEAKEPLRPTQILIDADGCPVIDLTIRFAKEKKLPVLLICDTSHEFHKTGAKTLTVDKGADSVDFRLASLVNPGDIVVTQDYGLAAMVLAKKGYALRQDGLEYTCENIDALLLARHTAKKIRRGGGHLPGPKKRSAQNNINFDFALRTLYNRIHTI